MLNYRGLFQGLVKSYSCKYFILCCLQLQIQSKPQKAGGGVGLRGFWGLKLDLSRGIPRIDCAPPLIINAQMVWKIVLRMICLAAATRSPVLQGGEVSSGPAIVEPLQ